MYSYGTTSRVIAEFTIYRFLWRPCLHLQLYSYGSFYPLPIISDYFAKLYVLGELARGLGGWLEIDWTGDILLLCRFSVGS